MKHCTNCDKELSDDALFCPRCGTRQVSEADLVGTMLGDRYLVQAEIGRGGSGTVYRARHVSLGTHVAIKVLHPSLSSDEGAMERFRKEAVTVASIDNEHAVGVFDFSRLPDGRFYMVMELLDGQTLDQRLEKGRPLDVDEALDITVQAAEALAEVHALGFVHRDLRPRNIFLARRKGRENFVKILDFGMSKLLSPGVSPQATIGVRFSDPVYIAPEQIRGEAVDRRTDIYSLAVLLYEMLTGHPPFSGDGTVALLDQQLEKMPPLPSQSRTGLPPLLDAVVLKALAKNRETRFATMIEFRDALLKASGRGSEVQFASGSTRVAGQEQTGQGEGLSQRSGDPHASLGSLPVDIAPDRTVLGLGRPVPPPAAKGIVSESMNPDGSRVPDRDSRDGPKQRPDDHREPPGDAVSVQGPQQASGRSPGNGPVDQHRKEGPMVSEVATGKGRSVQKESIGGDVPGQEQAGLSQVEQSVGDASHLENGPSRTASTKGAEDREKRGDDGGDVAESDDASSDVGGQNGDQQPDPTMSQLWYSEGEEAQRALAALGGDGQESQTTLPAMYQQMDPGRHGASGRFLVAVTLVGLGIAALLVGLLVWHHRSENQSVGQDSLAEAVPAQDARIRLAHDAGMHGRGNGVSPRPDAGLSGMKDAVILSLPRDEVVVPQERSARERTRSRRRSGTNTRRARAGSGSERSGSETLPRPPGDSASGTDGKGQSASKEIEAGRTALKGGDLAAAKAHFQKAKSLGGGWRALAGLGEVAFEQGRYAEAARLLKRAARSGSLRTMLLLGDAYFKLGKLRQAKTVYQKVLRKSPANRAAKRNLDVVRHRLGESG